MQGEQVLSTVIGHIYEASYNPDKWPSVLEEVAKFLVGYEDPDKDLTRACKIVDVNYVKKMDLKVLSPVPNLIKSTYAETHNAMYKLMDDMIQSHKPT